MATQVTIRQLRKCSASYRLGRSVETPCRLSAYSLLQGPSLSSHSTASSFPSSPSTSCFSPVLWDPQQVSLDNTKLETFHLWVYHWNGFRGAPGGSLGDRCGSGLGGNFDGTQAVNLFVKQASVSIHAQPQLHLRLYYDDYMPQIIAQKCSNFVKAPSRDLRRRGP